MTPMWMPSCVVPPWTSSASLAQRDQEALPGALGVQRGEGSGNVTKLSVEPCEVRRS